MRKSKIGEPRGVPMHEFLVPLFEALWRAVAGCSAPRGDAYLVEYGKSGHLKTAIRGAAGAPESRACLPTRPATRCRRSSWSKRQPAQQRPDFGHAVTDMSRHYTDVPQASLIEAINSCRCLRRGAFFGGYTTLWGYTVV